MTRHVWLLLWWFVAFSQLAGWQPPQAFETKRECERVRAITETKLFPGDLISDCTRLDFETVGAE